MHKFALLLIVHKNIRHCPNVERFYAVTGFNESDIYILQDQSLLALRLLNFFEFQQFPFASSQCPAQTSLSSAQS